LRRADTRRVDEHATRLGELIATARERDDEDVELPSPARVGVGDLAKVAEIDLGFLSRRWVVDANRRRPFALAKLFDRVAPERAVARFQPRVPGE
jgi:hypothetical protein